MKVIPGKYSKPEMLGYNWSVTQMTKRSLELQIDFANPNYVSREEEPELLEITYNGGELFVSEIGLPLYLPSLRDRKIGAL